MYNVFCRANEYVQLSIEETQTTSILATQDISRVESLLKENQHERLGTVGCAFQRFKGLLIKRFRWILGMKVHMLVQVRFKVRIVVKGVF